MQQIHTVIATVDTATRFDEWGPDANPVIAHRQRQLTRQRITLRWPLWFAFIVGMLGLALSTWDVLTVRGEDDANELALFICLVGWIMLVVSPIFSATSAARHTRHAMRPERFDLLYVTPLSNEALVWSQVFGAILHVRRQYAILIALMPLMVVYTFYLKLELVNKERYIFSFWNYVPATPDYWDVVGPTLWAMAIQVGFWGLNLLATVFGVRMAIFRSNTIMAQLTALGGLVLVLLSPCVCFWCTLWMAGGYNGCLAGLIAYVFPVVFLVGSWIAACTMMRDTALIWRRE